MTDPRDAAEHLRVIRHLMERATVYRAISAPTALVASLVSLPVALYLLLQSRNAAFQLSPWGYLGIWFGVLILVDGFNTWLLWRDAKRRGASMASDAAMHALKSLFPPLFAGAVISTLTVHDSLFTATLCWVVFYGLALLATHGFAPTSMKVLGAGFLLAGLGIWSAARLDWIHLEPGRELTASSVVMAATFGLGHLVYGLVIGLRTRFRLNNHDRAASLA